MVNATEPVLERARGGAAWRVAVLITGVTLATIVGLARLGTPTTSAIQTPLAPIVRIAQASPPPSPAPPSVALPPSVAVLVHAIGRPIARSLDGLRYADGIPTDVDGQSVYRVRDALLAGIGKTVLVGGWYYPRDCNPILRKGLCAPGSISDSPSGSADTDTMFVDQGVAAASGAMVVRATIEVGSRCSVAGADLCLPSLHVLGQAWGGDAETEAGPLSVTAVMGSLAVAFPDLDLQPLTAEPGCPISWPSQTYVAAAQSPRRLAGPPVQAALLFPTTEARVAAERAIRRTVRRSAGQLDEQCAGLGTALAADARWHGYENALLLLGGSNAANDSRIDAAFAIARAVGAG
jgi:hypothetical protein